MTDSMTRVAVAAELDHRARLGRITRCAHCGSVIADIEDFGALGVSGGRSVVEDGCVSTYAICHRCVTSRCLMGHFQGDRVAVETIDKRVLAFEGFAFRIAGFPDPAPIPLFPSKAPGSTRDAWSAAVGCRAKAGLDLAVCGVCELPMSLPQDVQVVLAVVTGHHPAEGAVVTAFGVCAACLRGNVYPETESRIESCVRPRWWANVGQFYSFPPRVPCADHSSQ